MAGQEYGGLVEEWKVNMITKRAKRYGFRDDDIPDLKQRIVPEIIKADFVPCGGAKESTFIIAIIDRQLKTVLRDRRRSVRKANYVAEIYDEQEIIDQDSFFSMGEAERTELRLDLERALTGLSAEEKEICKGLMEGDSQAELARVMGKSTSEMSRVVARLRDKLSKWGLGMY